MAMLLFVQRLLVFVPSFAALCLSSPVLLLFVGFLFLWLWKKKKMTDQITAKAIARMLSIPNTVFTSQASLPSEADRSLDPEATIICVIYVHYQFGLFRIAFKMIKNVF